MYGPPLVPGSPRATTRKWTMAPSSRMPVKILQHPVGLFDDLDLVRVVCEGDHNDASFIVFFHELRPMDDEAKAWCVEHLIRGAQ